MVLDPDYGPELELRCHQGGISPSAPPRPKPQVQSVPPILRRQHQNSMPGYSKGAQGLSVYVRVTGIFTGATDSPSALRRQCPNRYAIRAGRNLPDKEFRYLRTVIVTAAVYWGFGSPLRSEELTDSLNLPAPGRRQTLYVVLPTSQSPVFLVNSRYPLLSATPVR